MKEIQEIERKFLVKNDSWKRHLSKNHLPMAISQAYIVNEPEISIRVQYRLRRINREWERGSAVNIKTPREGLVRDETELPIEWQTALRIIEAHRSTRHVIDKVRSFVDITETRYWEIDEFAADLKGLVVAEIELPAADFDFELPSWVGEEVTDDPRYYNARLALSQEIPNDPNDLNDGLGYLPIG